MVFAHPLPIGHSKCEVYQQVGEEEKKYTSETRNLPFFFYFSLYLKSSKLVQGLLTLVIGTSCLSMTGLRGQKGRKLFQLCLLNLENQFMVYTKHSMGKI